MQEPPRGALAAYYSWNYCVSAGESAYHGPWRLYTAEEIADSPSRRDGVSAHAERRQKWLMITLLNRVGTALAS